MDSISNGVPHRLLHEHLEQRIHTLFVFKSPGDAQSHGHGHRVRDELQDGRADPVGHRHSDTLWNHDGNWNKWRNAQSNDHSQPDCHTQSDKLPYEN